MPGAPYMGGGKYARLVAAAGKFNMAARATLTAKLAARKTPALAPSVVAAQTTEKQRLEELLSAAEAVRAARVARSSSTSPTTPASSTPA